MNNINYNMKQKLIIILIFTGLFSFGQELPVPNGYEIIRETTGDLDKDGINEKVVIYNTADSTVWGIVREIQILKLSKGTWTEWKKSRNALMNGEDSEPYDLLSIVKIENGILVIGHEGGHIGKWHYTDKYRFQNNQFELIGHTSYFAQICEFITDLDFNISTGKIKYKNEFVDCELKIYKTENETFYKKNVKINLNNRNSKQVEIISPKYKHDLSF